MLDLSIIVSENQALCENFDLLMKYYAFSTSFALGLLIVCLGIIVFVYSLYVFRHTKFMTSTNGILEGLALFAVFLSIFAVQILGIAYGFMLIMDPDAFIQINELCKETTNVEI